MAKESVGTVYVDVEANDKNYKNQINSTVKGTENAFSRSMKKVAGFVAGAFAVKKIVDFTKSAVGSATEVQSAFTGLNSIVQGTGNSFADAQKFINEYTKDGLVSINETATAYKNLLSRGYDTSQIEDVMNRLKDSASFGRQASYDLGEAVVSATEGLKNENSILVDNAGVTKNVAKMWEEYANAHGTTTNAMTQAQKIEAEYNGIMKETQFQVGDATAYTRTFSGQIQQLKFSFNQMMVAIGKVVAPIAQLFIPIINSAIGVVTNFFVKLQGLLKVFGLEMPDVVSKASSSVSDIGSGAVDTAGDIASVGDSATKTAKKVNRAFGSMDEINVLSTKQDTDSSAGGGGSSSVNTPTADTSKNVEKTDGAFSKLIDRVKELQSLFMKGFNTTFNVDFESIYNHIKGIGKSLKDIFTDKDVVNAGNNWANTLMYNLGKVVGSVATIGGNIAEGLVGSIDIYLKNNSGRIKKFIIDMFNISSRDIDLSGKLFESLASISEVFKSDTAKNIGANIIGMFANPLMSATELMFKFGVDVKSLLLTPIIENTDKIKDALNNTFKPLETITGTLKNALTYIGDLFNKVYDEHLHPFFKSLTKGLSDTFGKFLDMYNEYVAPFLQWVADGFSNTWNEHLKPLWDNLSAFIGSIIDLMKLMWEQWLKPLVDWVVVNVVPVLIPIIQQIWSVVSFVFNHIIDIISVILGVLSGLIDFVVGVFTGDWDKAWNGISHIFESVWNYISSTINNVIVFIGNIVQSGIDLIVNTATALFNTLCSNITYIWNTIKNIITTVVGAICSFLSNGFNGIKNTITNIWNTIANSISNTVNTIKNTLINTFQNAYNRVTSLFSNLGGFFSGLWNNIKNTFSNLGTQIGNAISGSVRTGINGVISLIERTINSAINLINGGIGMINLIPGVNIGRIRQLYLPRLAQGGWFAPNDPQLAIVGDNTREPEVVAPESKIYDQVIKAMKDSGNSTKQEITIKLMVMYEDGRMMIKKINQEQIDAGEILLLT